MVFTPIDCPPTTPLIEKPLVTLRVLPRDTLTIVAPLNSVMFETQHAKGAAVVDVSLVPAVALSGYQALDR